MLATIGRPPGRQFTSRRGAVVDFYYPQESAETKTPSSSSCRAPKYDGRTALPAPDPTNAYSGGGAHDLYLSVQYIGDQSLSDENRRCLCKAHV